MGDQGGIDQQPPQMDPSRRGGGMNVEGAPRRRQQQQQQQPGEARRSTNERSPGYSSSDGLGSRRGSADEDDVGQDDLFMPTDVPEPDDPTVKDVPAFTTGRFKNHQRKTLKEQAKHLQSGLITQMENAHSNPDAGEWLLEDELCGGKGCTDPHGTASLRGADDSLVYSAKIDWKAKHLDEKACCITKAEFYVKHTHLFTRCTECDDDGHIVDRGDDWKAEAQHKGSTEYGNSKRKQGYAQPDGDDGLTRRGYENKEVARGREALNEGREGGVGVDGGDVEQRKEGDEEVAREMPGPFDKSADRVSEGSEVSDTQGGSEEAGPFDRSANMGGGSSEEGKVAGTFGRARDKLPETKVRSGGERKAAGDHRGGGDEGNDASKGANKGKKGQQQQQQQPDPTSKRQMKKAARRAQKAAATKAKVQGPKGNSTPGEHQQPTREEEKRAKLETGGRQQADPTSKRQMKRAAKKAERKARKEAAKNSNKNNGKK
ncbi:hypothetical protein FOZ63_025657 [Perkinsus olseni]|uniref:Uncharacterized protein n=1 Tax=Perkinsus olseni TaxID=32597 RepID=A0A7J6QU28_PEROL|nr:hypothetical protein FOZ62_027346 [Perkinsus olseni]KAF4721493.1 hypothetical protein FOZ63_025657 [Perkinsus olseni]